MMWVTGFDEASLIEKANSLLPSDLGTDYWILIERRKTCEPIAYILGEREFWGKTYRVTPDVLIPRPDSETLVAGVLRRRKTADTILDLGTGSGCLLGALVSEYHNAIGIGVDASAGATHIASHNMRALHIANRTLILQSDWLTAVSGSFDIIVTNPPYIDQHEAAGLCADVREHEPASALFSPQQGRSDYQTILDHVGAHLNPGGLLAVEIGDGQSDFLTAYARTRFAATSIELDHDLAGRPRALLIST